MLQPPILIYVVDDDEDDLLFLSNAFREIGLENVCKGFLSGEDLFQHLKFNAAERMPDIVVLDYELPKMNGKEIMIALLKHPDFHSVRFIFYSDNITPKVDGELTRLGAFCCIRKGITINDQVRFAKTISDFLKKDS